VPAACRRAVLGETRTSFSRAFGILLANAITTVPPGRALGWWSTAFSFSCLPYAVWQVPSLGAQPARGRAVWAGLPLRALEMPALVGVSLNLRFVLLSVELCL